MAAKEPQVAQATPVRVGKNEPRTMCVRTWADGTFTIELPDGLPARKSLHGLAIHLNEALYHAIWSFGEWGANGYSGQAGLDFTRLSHEFLDDSGDVARVEVQLVAGKTDDE